MASIGNSPLTARSVLASALLGADPPELPVSYLVRLAGLFGVNENRARVALSRMVAAGEAVAVGGKRYRLAGHLLDRQCRQTASRAGAAGRWLGGWRVAVVTSVGATAAVRRRRRQALTHQRLAELRDGVWLRPDNLEVDLDPGLCGEVQLLHATVEHDAALAARLWPLDGWAERARALMTELQRHVPERSEDLAPGFELSAAVLRHLQADPLLPAELLPEDWPGSPLRTAYGDWDRRYRELLAAWARAPSWDFRP